MLPRTPPTLSPAEVTLISDAINANAVASAAFKNGSPSAWEAGIQATELFARIKNELPTIDMPGMYAAMTMCA